MNFETCPAAETNSLFTPTGELFLNLDRRRFLRVAGLLMAGTLGYKAYGDQGPRAPEGSGQKVIVVVIGGIRRDETFSPEGIENIPYMSSKLLDKSAFYRHIRNEGVTAHFNAIASILTGNWQHVDDWGKLAPTSPTIFEHFRKEFVVDRSAAWVVASNKALTNLIGASSNRDFGPAYGANVVFPKQLMITAVVDALRQGRSQNMADRSAVEAELHAVLEGSNYEGLGWNVFDSSDRLDPSAQEMVRSAISTFVRSGGATSGDELTFLMSKEVMRKFAPQVLVVAFSDVEAAHFGSFALHLSGIKTADRLVHQLWEEVEVNPEYKDKTTLIVLPEFGRDPDGSSTNGFFNHRSDVDSTRDTWMMVLGSAVDKPQIIERPVRHVDVYPTLSNLLGCGAASVQGISLTELRSEGRRSSL